ncbi:hypothetical protein EP7_001302 [Isosphaeraceae bacterium EP7]
MAIRSGIAGRWMLGATMLLTVTSRGQDAPQLRALDAVDAQDRARSEARAREAAPSDAATIGHPRSGTATSARLRAELAATRKARVGACVESKKRLDAKIARLSAELTSMAVRSVDGGAEVAADRDERELRGLEERLAMLVRRAGAQEIPSSESDDEMAERLELEREIGEVRAGLERSRKALKRAVRPVPGVESRPVPTNRD